MYYLVIGEYMGILHMKLQLISLRPRWSWDDLMISIVLLVCLGLGQIKTLELFFHVNVLMWIGVPNSQVKQRIEVILPKFLLVMDLHVLLVKSGLSNTYEWSSTRKWILLKIWTPIPRFNTSLLPWTSHFFFGCVPLHRFSGNIRDHPAPRPFLDEHLALVQKSWGLHP